MAKAIDIFFNFDCTFFIHLLRLESAFLKLNLCSPVHRMAIERKWVADCILYSYWDN